MDVIKIAVEEVYNTTFSVEPTCDFEEVVERGWRSYCRKYGISYQDSSRAIILKYAVSHAIMFSILQDAITSYIKDTRNREVFYAFISTLYEESKEEVEKMIEGITPSNPLTKEDVKFEKDNLINLINEIMDKAKKAKELIGENADD